MHTPFPLISDRVDLAYRTDTAIWIEPRVLVLIQNYKLTDIFIILGNVCKRGEVNLTDDLSGRMFLVGPLGQGLTI